jgi:hypothetical protein
LALKPKSCAELRHTFAHQQCPTIKTARAIQKRAAVAGGSK